MEITIVNKRRGKYYSHSNDSTNKIPRARYEFFQLWSRARIITENIPVPEEQLISVVKDLFAAGVETTNNTIGFVITYLAVRQDVQGKVHEEIERILGKETLPCIAHKNRYTLTQRYYLLYCRLQQFRCYSRDIFQAAVFERNDSRGIEIGERRSHFDPSSCNDGYDSIRLRNQERLQLAS